MMDRENILAWLREDDPERLEILWRQADAVRQRHVGDAVHLRGLIEVSSHCARRCWYCGLRAANRAMPRYRLTDAEVRECVEKAVGWGYGTVVLQAGEDDALTAGRVAAWVRWIRAETPLAVTLSLGERPDRELEAWRDAGADRYLLRFETSNPALLERIHPPRAGRGRDRFAMLRRLRRLGYEIGSGVMIGLPGQTYEDLAEDVLWFGRLDLDMIGTGPYLPHPATPLGRAGDRWAADLQRQVPNSELMTYKVLALARLVCPLANIPSTTALATLNRANGRELGLARGANVVMPNLTPARYRSLYDIYPDKACVNEPPEQCNGCLRARIAAIGRTVGTGPGHSPRRLRRDAAFRDKELVRCP